ncbi:MAG: DUF1800 domain-containing protein [Acidobacteriota bacterium]
MRKLISAVICIGLLGGSSWAQTQVRRSSPQAPPTTASTFEKWDKRDAAHLLRRAGFGGSEADIQQIYTLGRTAAIDFLVNYEDADNSLMDAKMAAYDNPNPGLGLDVSKLQYGQTTLINGAPVDTRYNYYLTQVERWWVFRMANSRKPLEEKLALFWHDHFATGAGKVNDWQYMLWQNELLRAGAGGNFRTFVTEVSKDPAMLVWLDNRLNVRGRPQENFARELMELFTIGIGNYTENDIKESAKAFTGWGLRNRVFTFTSGSHDTSNKTFLGVSINGLAGDLGVQEGLTILRLLTEHPVTARYMSEKLFEFFAYDDPSPDVISRLAAVFVANKDQDDQIKKVVRAIFESPEFWSEKAQRSQVKSPIEYVVTAMKQLNASINWTQSRGNTVNPAYASQQMGMRMFEPPDVAGWDWGTSWFNTATTLVRFNYANSVATARLGSDGRVTQIYVDPTALMKDKNLVSADDVVDYFLELMVESEVSDDTRYALTEYLQTDDAGKYVPFTLSATMIDKKVRGLIYLIMIHPEYQMK